MENAVNQVFNVHKVTKVRFRLLFYKFFTLGTFYFINFPLLSAQSKMADSLYNVLKTEKEDTGKVNNMNDLSTLLWRMGNYDTAMVYATTAQALAEKIKFKKGISAAFRNIGVIYYYQGNYPKALDYDYKALDINKQIDNKQGTATNLSNIGLVYYRQGNYSKALDLDFQALTVAEEIGDDNRIGITYGNIGNIYGDLRDYNKVLEYDEKALAIAKETGNKGSIAVNLGNIGDAYEDLGNYPKALEYDFKALKFDEETGDKNGIATNLGNIGNIYADQGNTAKALDYDFKALQLDEEIGDKNAIASNFCNIGSNYTRQKNYTLAKAYLDSSFTISKQIGNIEDIKGAYSATAALDSAQGNYKAGWEDYKKFIFYRDSILNKANTEKTVQAEMSHQFEQRQALEKAEQDKKDIETELAQKKQSIVRDTFMVGFVLMLVLAFFIFRSYTQKQKAHLLITKQKLEVERQKALMEENNMELERLSIVARETENLILIMDANGKVEWANESFARMNGITIDELKKQKGETIYEISNNPEIRNIIAKAVKERKSVVYESLNQKIEGKKIWESSTLTPIFDKEGKLRKIIIVDQDITRRKNDEEIIQQKNKDITDSILYAKRLQDAILPPLSLIQKYFPESFVLYKPKDIVAGDFYWMERAGDTVFIAAADCTGHGVPGALVSVVCSNALNRTVKEFKITEPGKILDKVRELVLETFEKSESNVQDGMDISLLAISRQSPVDSIETQWSGAYNSLWYIQDGEMKEVPADKQPIGKNDSPLPFSTHTLKLKKGDTLYLFTDGYADQFGGPKGKKFKYKQLQEELLAISPKPMTEQKQELERVLDDWKGDLEQVDDVLIIGIRV